MARQTPPEARPRMSQVGGSAGASRAARPSLRVGRLRHPATVCPDGWSPPRRRGSSRRRETESGLQASSSAPALVGFAHRPVQLLQRVVELLAGALRQVVLQLIKQPVGEGVLAGGVSGLGLAAQMGAADDAVLMVTEQRLDGLGAVGNLAIAGGRRGVAKSLGALADSVQRLVAVGVGGLCGGLGRLADPLVRRVDGERRRLLAGRRRAAARWRPAPPARRAAGSSASTASRSAIAAARPCSASWRRRPAAPAPARAPARRAARRASARSARRAPRRRGPPPESPASCRNSSSTQASSEMPNAPSDACSRLRILRVVTRIWCTES